MGVLLVFANEASNDNHALIKNMFLRLNHLLKSKRDIYMDMTPVIIPIQGAPRVLSASVFRLGFLCAAVSYFCWAHVLQVSIRMGSST
jgi:hypothetical protein